MRKKSHIDLAKYLIDNSDECRYRKIMYFGSILPDIVPTFIYKRHRIDTTLEIVRKEIEKVIEQESPSKMYCLRLGIISHYISDYFTLPHNKEFVGNMREHCRYEKELISQLRQRIVDEESKEYKLDIKQINVNDILNYIVARHNEYVEKVNSFKHTIQDDCEYITNVDINILQLIEYARASELRRKHKNFIGEAILQTSIC